MKEEKRNRFRKYFNSKTVTESTPQQSEEKAKRF